MPDVTRVIHAVHSVCMLHTSVALHKRHFVFQKHERIYTRFSLQILHVWENLRIDNILKPVPQQAPN